MSYNAKIRRLQGGNVLEVITGGEVRLNGGTITNNGTQATAIADATAATGGDAPTEAEYNALVTKLNSVLAALRGASIIAT
jgi:hypothetical protein